MHVLQTAVLEQLSLKLQKTTVKLGPCESSVEPVLQRHNIQRQKYFGGAFIGNHIHHALQHQVTHAIAYSHVQVVQNRCPALLNAALTVTERYDKAMTQYADCSEIFSSAEAVNPSILHDLEGKIKEFMFTAREEIVRRDRGRVTPKLHMLEAHVLDSMGRFGVGLGMLGEQGGESLHAEFNLLTNTFRSVVREIDRLAMIVKQHCLTTLPQQLAKDPAVARR